MLTQSSMHPFTCSIIARAYLNNPSEVTQIVTSEKTGDKNCHEEMPQIPTVTEPVEKQVTQNVTSECHRELDCGGRCFLTAGHAGKCLCIGDIDGPGTCPA